MKLWPQVQATFGDIPDARGVALRREHYARFFLRFGANVVIEEGCRFYHPDRIVLEDDVRINIGCLIYGSGGVRIGRHARIGPRTFIHSANHDVEPNNPLAFHERGYRYARVDIGDNVLISANVSILPGVTLANGSFAACGAVLPKGAYTADSYLVGSPARHLVSTADTAVAGHDARPEVAIVAREGSHTHRTLQHMLQVLLLPQVALVSPEANLAPSVRTVVLTDTEEISSRSTGSPDVTVWKVSPGPIHSKQRLPSSRALQVNMPGRYLAVALPSSVTYEAHPAPNGDAMSKAGNAAFWLRQRLFKRGEPLPMLEFCEWACALALFDPCPDGKESLYQRIGQRLYQRRPDSLPVSAPAADRSGIEWAAFLDRCRAHLCDSTGTASPPPESSDSRPATAVTKSRALRNAELLWRLVADPHCADKEAVANRLAGLIDSARSSRDLLIALLGGRLLGLKAIEAAATEALTNASWWPPNCAFPKTIQAQAGLLLSPLVLIWWVSQCDTEQARIPVEILLEARTKQHELDWTLFPGRAVSWYSTDLDASLVDVDKRLISSSLVENWRELHSAPYLGGEEFVLSQHNYHNGVWSCEQVWLSLFEFMLSQQGRPLIRIVPWPAPYRSAMSIRYDVDRPVTASRVTELAREQAVYANAPCASWYFRRQDPGRSRLQALLDRHWQECGTHLEAVDGPYQRQSVTFHSAPTSAYWRGEDTLAQLARNGASCAEFLMNDLDTPRPWLGGDAMPDEGRLRAEAMFLVPIHFPLEGGTSDRDLSYFDAMLPSFRARLARGGHAIIGTHPDLEHGLLSELLQREDVSFVWLAPVETVVGRVRDIALKARIRSVEGSDQCAAINLVSDISMADVQVDLCWGDGCERRTLQFVAGVPRGVPFAKVSEGRGN